MKRLAIFIGGLLVLPAFGEVAPIFYDDIEYTDVVYDEYGNPVYYVEEDESDLTPTVNENATKPSASTSRNTSGTRSNTNRTTIGRTVPTAATTTATGRGVAANSSRAVAARTTTNASPRSTTNARSVASRGTTSRTTSTGATRTTTNAAASAAAANRATGGAGRASASATRTSSGGASVARTTTTRATATSRGGTTSRVATTGSRVNRAATNAAVAIITDHDKVTSAAPVYVTSISGTTGTGPIELNTSKNPLYNPSRVSVASSRVGSRVPTIRMATATGISTGEVSVTAADLSAMDELAEMTDYCKAQYAACMDNYCNVLDDNQGRCSCSANIKNYANAEAALKQATEELQEVAQKIQYIGLSAREVETLFTQTEAELKMQTTTDTSQLKTSLDKIKDMIIEVQSGTASSTANSSALSFDLSGLLDFTIDSTGFDLTSFLGGFGTTTTGGINNQRGAELFKTATNRCKTNVLRACTAAGVDASLITNAYDLEIDKECIIYERALNDSNDQMVATVRNAKNVLQRARLLVEQSKNEYDMRGCINALDACMQDEYVCGSDYEKCLDPSGRYIVNGEIVIGSDPGRAVNGRGDETVGVLDGDICTMNLYNVWNYSGSTAGQTMGENCTNAWNSYSLNTNNGNLSGYINDTLGSHDGLGMSQYIQSKIGWKGTGKDSDKNYGMCMSVLNKCQDYTYTGTGSSRKYNPENEVVKQYLERMLVQIKAKQDEILAEHAESCIADVQSCLSQNGYPFDEENFSANSVAANIAINACRSTIVTCMSVNGYSVNNPTPSDLWPWVCGITTGSTDCGGDTPSRHNITWRAQQSGTDVSQCSTSFTTSDTDLVIWCNPGQVSGAIFKGWCTNTQGTSGCYTAGNVAQAKIPANYDEDITFYGQWQNTGTYTYTITYDCDFTLPIVGSVTWDEIITGNSASITTTLANQNYVVTKCVKPNYIPQNFVCTPSGKVSGNTTFGNNVTVSGDVTCKVQYALVNECSLTSPQYCESEPDCTSAGGTWNSGTCTSGPTVQRANYSIPLTFDAQRVETEGN